MRHFARRTALTCALLLLPAVAAAEGSPLTITVKAPQEVRKDAKVVYKVMVTNHRRKGLKDVVLTVQEPDWLFFRKGRSEDGKCHLEFAREHSGELNKVICDKTTLGAYQSLMYTITFDAAFDQSYCNNVVELTAYAGAKNAEDAVADVTTDITCPLL